MKSKNFKEPLSKKKTIWNETETDKRKREKFQWTEEMVEYLLDLLKRYKVMSDFSGKDFDSDKTVQYSKLGKEMVKKYESLGPIETPTNLRADLSIQEKRI